MTDGKLIGKIIAVAGGGGIGDELARYYAREGAVVALGDLRGDAAREVAASIVAAGGQAKGFDLDGADEASVNSYFKNIVEQFGGIDGCHLNFASLVDAAGGAGNVLDLPLDSFDTEMRINARGFFLCTRAVVPLLIARGGGSIVYTSSGSAQKASMVRVAYSMSKAAGHALMRHVALVYGAHGIRANTITPGYISHPRLEALNVPGILERATAAAAYKPRVGRPLDIAAMGALLLSDEGSFITGQVLAVDGGSTMNT